MARKSMVSDKTILEAILSAKKRQWTAQEAAASITVDLVSGETMTVGTFRSRVNSLKELLRKQGQSKYVKIIETAFVDGRGRNPSTKNPQETVDLFASMFDGLDELEDVEETEAEVETPQEEVSLELN